MQTLWKKKVEENEKKRKKLEAAPSATFVDIVVVALFVQHGIILGRICALERAQAHALAHQNTKIILL